MQKSIIEDGKTSYMIAGSLFKHYQASPGCPFRKARWQKKVCEGLAARQQNLDTTWPSTITSRPPSVPELPTLLVIPWEHTARFLALGMRVSSVLCYVQNSPAQNQQSTSLTRMQTPHKQGHLHSDSLPAKLLSRRMRSTLNRLDDATTRALGIVP